MAVKIRLQRHGHKDYAFYPIVIADSRAPRDGRFIERIGSYNPNTNPATISLNFDRALYWLSVGAQPTDTVRSILSREGVMLMKHLQGGVKKGAFDEAEAQRRFDAWKTEKNAKLEAIRNQEREGKRAAAKKALEEEVKKNEAKAEAVAKKRAEIAAAKAAAEAEAAAAAQAEAEAAKAAEEAANATEAPAAPAEEAPAEA
ncbi:MAG: 30S ribosomal protein S16 [Muribaculaceae bacterium]|nr:30S ribosomal protein S16 [Muribaculaceae bacterium]